MLDVRYCRVWNLSLIKLESFLIWLLFNDSGFASNQSPTRIHKEYTNSTVVNYTWQVRVCSSTGKHGSLCARFVYLVSEKKDNAFRNRARWYKGMFNFRFRRKLHCDICPSIQIHGKSFRETFPRANVNICPWSLLFHQRE